MVTTWTPDTELDGFEQCVVPLSGAETFPGEPAEISATLIRRGPARQRRAVLYLHGWSDYFFQSHVAEAFEASGFDFYALDLRRYGRSLRTGQLAGYITRLEDYYSEIDASVAIIAEDGHDSLLVSGHSTGGLVVSLWAADHPGEFDAVVLNAPWLDMHHSPYLRPAMAALVGAVQTLSPTAAIPVSDPGLYRRSISLGEEGLWEYNPSLKGDPSFLLRFGWLKAILQGQERVAKGLGIDVPILVSLSARSIFATKWRDEMASSDTVLDVERLAARAGKLGRHVTVARVEGGLHDLSLSADEPRAQYFADVARWLRAYALEPQR